ncbi:MAG: protein kinase [Candidatus Krumholzibacteria bacterium]
MIGKTLLHYEIVEKLGEGGMGEVYRARDSKLGRDVALKILPQEMSRDPERRKRFEREARVIAALKHPNIVTIHSVEEVDDRLFLTMELVEGKTLRELIPEEGVSLGMLFSVAVPLVDAVCSAHAKGITHRDLKPANVMLDDEGRLKVLDFGLAKLFQEAKGIEDAKTVGLDTDTQEGRILGTVAYMSPEQVEGKALDGRSDIFSLGILFYEMATGRRPFGGDTNISTISSILKDTPPPVTEIRQRLPYHLGRIIRRCLSKEPNRRYQSALDLRNDLQELAEEVDSGDVAVDGGETAGVSSVTTGTASAGIQKPISSDSIVLPGTKSTYRRILGLVGLAVVAAIVIGFVVKRLPDNSRTGSAAVVTGEKATLAVIGFENLSDPEDTENLGRVLMGLVTTGLAESGGLKVASTAKVLAARRQVGAGDRVFDASLAPAAARDAGADVMLVGQVIRDGERMILTAELVDVTSGNALGSFKKQAASSSELFELAGAIARDVRDLMGVTDDEGTSSDFDLAQSLTDSPEAYRHYAAGEMALHQGQYDEAAELFEQAIKIDRSFALAYLRIMMAYTWNGETGKGVAAMKLGLPYVERLPERWQVVYQANIDYYDDNIDAAYKRLMRLIESSPDIPDAYNTLGEITTHQSKYTDIRRSREYFERALEIDPTFEVVFFHLVEDYIAGNDVRALENLIARYRDANPNDPRVVDAELALLEAQHKYDDVIARIDDKMREGDVTRWTRMARCLEAIGDWDRAFELSAAAVQRNEKGYNHAFAIDRRGSAQIGRGNIAKAMADYDAASAHLEAMGAPGGWAASIVCSYRIKQAFVLTHTGDLDGALGAARKGIEVDPHNTSAYLALLQTLLRAGRTAEAQETLRDLQKVREANQNPSDAFVVLMAEAEWERAQGNADKALEALHRADTLPIETRYPWTQWWIEGDVMVLRGDRQGAINAYRKIVEPEPFLVGQQAAGAAFRIPFYYELARLEEEAGQLAKARQHYNAYLEHWGNADVSIPKVDDARTRLAKLGAQM